MIAYDIEWDFSDYEEGGEYEGEELPDLPKELGCPKGLSIDEVADWLSDEFGYCVKGFKTKRSFKGEHVE